MSVIIRRTLSEQVAEQILNHIVSSRLVPGDRLPPEGALAEEYGVSRPVVREAMRSLQARGVTETANGKSAIIRRPDAASLEFYFSWGSRLRPDALIELMEVRRGIEMQAATLAARRRTAPQIGELQRLVELMRQSMGDPDVYAENDLQFHLEIARASHNETIQVLVESIRSVLRDSIVEGLKARRTQAEMDKVQELHEEILRDLVAGDADASLHAMMSHFDDAVTAMVRSSASVEGQS